MKNAFKLNTSTFSKELNLLVHILETKHPIHPFSFSISFLKDINWRIFLRLAKFHRVYPVIYTYLKNSNTPPSILKILQNEFMINTFEMLHLSRTMGQICRLFNEKNIRALLLKGPALAKDLYGDTSLRTCKDLDILIPLEKFEQADKLLISLGFTIDDDSPRVYNWKKRLHHCSYTKKEEGIQIEIHWRLNPGSWSEPAFDELWSRKQECSLSNACIYHLGNEDLFLYLTTHGARHSWFRLRWLVDFKQLLMKDLDWSLIIHLLKQYDAYIVGGQALILCSQLLGTTMNPSIQRFFFSSVSQNAAQTAIGYISRMDKPNAYAIEYTRYLLSLMSFRQKCIYLKSYYYPSSNDALTLPLPSLFHFLYFPLRPLLWLWRRLKYVTRAREL